MRKLFLLLWIAAAPAGWWNEAPAREGSKADREAAKQGGETLVSDDAAAIDEMLAEMTGQKYWYGIYMQGHKIGYANIEEKDLRKSVPSVVEVTMSLVMEAKSENKTLRMQTTNREVYEGAPPYRLRSAVEETRQQGEVERISITRSPRGKKYSARIVQGGTTRSQKFNLDYTLLQFLREYRWLRSSPSVGDTLETKSLDMLRLRTMRDKLVIKEKKTGLFDGVETTYYVISATDEDGFTMENLVLADGTLVKFSMGEVVEARLEPEKVAKKLDAPRDLFVDNLVPVEGVIDNPSRIKRMVIEVDSSLGEVLGNASGQRVLAEPKTRTCRVMVTSDNARDVKVTKETRKKGLEASVEIPTTHPKVIALAAKAVGDAETRREKVNRLVRFVDKYVIDSYTAEPLTVLDTIKRRRGDCTEHSALFATLSRSLGIPTRIVDGLIYGELGSPSFSGHTWNEVELDGYWVPVDSTWNETTTNATHIRFPIEMDANMQAFSRLPKARIKVIALTKGKK